MDYKVSSSSPTDELLTLGQILSEVGAYASTVLDRDHLTLSRECGTRLRNVVVELVSRQSIKSEDELYDVPQTGPSGSDLSALSIGELHELYRRWPVRHRDREAEGREHFTFYYEDRIVNELLRRKVVGKAEQLKVDYCVATYCNELDNMSSVFSLPVQIDGEKIYPDSGRRYSPDELTALIRLYGDYRDIVDRELLVEYVDHALDLLEQSVDSASTLRLLTAVAELGRRKRIRVPGWVNRKLEDMVDGCASLKGHVPADMDCALAEAMLTLQLLNGDNSLIRKAERIINRCWKSASEDDADPGTRIECLHTAVMCRDYVTRYSVRKAVDLWNGLSGKALSADAGLFSRHIFLMLEMAGECVDCPDISGASVERLGQMLDLMANTGSPESTAYSRICRTA